MWASTVNLGFFLISFPKHQGIPCVTDCVMAELEKLGHRYRVALRWVRCHGACMKKIVDFTSLCIESRATLDLNVYDVHIQVPMPTIVWFSESWHINASLSLLVTENYAVESVKYPVCRWCISWGDDMLLSVFQIKALRVENFLSILFKFAQPCLTVDIIDMIHDLVN